MGLDTEEEEQEEPQLSPDRKKYIDECIQHRICMNALTNGSSIHIWKSICHLLKNRLDKIDPQLFDLYETYVAIVSFQLWQININQALEFIADGQESGLNGFITQGMSELKKKDGGVAIESKGVNTPVLLHELNKGVFEYLSLQGLPQDLSADELSYVYRHADKYQDELFHYLLSPTLWNNLLDAANVYSEDLPKMISKIAKLNYNQLSNLLINVTVFPVNVHEKLKSCGIIE